MPIGSPKVQGFTLIELMLVLLLVALLASLATPVVMNSIEQAKESTLKENLYILRKAVDAYYADHRVYPPELEQLVDKRYIRQVPDDPLTGRRDTWLLTWVETPTEDGKRVRGIGDVHSGAPGQSREGTRYAQW